MNIHIENSLRNKDLDISTFHSFAVHTQDILNLILPKFSILGSKIIPRMYVNYIILTNLCNYHWEKNHADIILHRFWTAINFDKTIIFSYFITIMLILFVSIQPMMRRRFYIWNMLFIFFWGTSTWCNI